MIADILCKILSGRVRPSAESAAVCIFIGEERVTLWGLQSALEGERNGLKEEVRQSGRVGMRGHHVR